ncbi:MAG: NPCBM/NEW2 domain-containing protein [Clostridia bacterium]|nr:NPCBM/NEW2 domain-containing protein [Clostridia bacterium]
MKLRKMLLLLLSLSILTVVCILPAFAATANISNLKREQTANFEPIVYDEITNPESKPYGSWQAGNNAKVYLSDLPFTGTAAGGNTPFKDAPYKGETGAGVAISQVHKFAKGFGTHPVTDYSPSEPGYSQITVDIQKYTDPNGQYKFNHFYAAAGLTNRNSAGVWFMVYGDYGDGKGFVQLACSNKSVVYNYGEFNVDITGVHTISLIVVADSSYSSSACAWGECSIFTKDPNAVKPDYREVDATIIEPPVKQPVETEEKNTDPTPEPTQEGCSSTLSAGLGALLVVLSGAVPMIGKRKETER